MANTVKRKYKHNFLTQVIFQVTYMRYDAIDEASMKAFKARLGEDYPILESVKQQGVIIQNDGSDIKAKKEDDFLWQIESSQKDHVIMANRDNFSITFNKYINFRRYIDVVTNALGAFTTTFEDIKDFNRLGLRYVNQIRLNESDVDWSNYIHENLVDSFRFIDVTKIRRSMHSLVVQHDDETLVTITYGVYNPFFPEPILENEFILDIDAYTPTSIPIGSSEQLLESFNTTIAIYFEMSIKDKLREIMEEIDGKVTQS